MSKIIIKDLGEFDKDCGLVEIDKCSDGFNAVGKDGVVKIYATGDRKVELLCYADHTVAYVLSAIGHPAYYPIHPVSLKKPIKAVLMDLDGTSVRSEEFWGMKASDLKRQTCLTFRDILYPSICNIA